MANRYLTIKLCAPRGFCAGVDRAIQIVDQALDLYGPPVYVRHEIVHNKFVVDGLRKKGAIFVEELDEIPPTDAPVVFSAHGVAKSVPAAAKARNLFVLDATCPLVSKVHKQALLNHSRGYELVLVGHAGHPEVIGTMGQLPKGAVHLIETLADARAFRPTGDKPLAYITQTTLSVDDTREIVETLRSRFPQIKVPYKEDICYATTNRQAAVKAVAPGCDAMIVVGAPNSSNSQRLVEVAERSGCTKAKLVQRASEIDWTDFQDVAVLGLTAGASAPDVLVEEIIEAFQERFSVRVEIITTAREDVAFHLPRSLREAADTKNQAAAAESARK